MSEAIKQTNPGFARAPYDAIQTDGCFWRTLLHCGEHFTGKLLSIRELQRAFHFSIPDYMEDHRRPGEDRCYILGGGHVEVIRIGFYILGERNVDIEYAYRQDFNTRRFVIGKAQDFYRCNYYISKCAYKKTGHFYESDLKGAEEWNPGQTFNPELLSMRGFVIRVR